MRISPESRKTIYQFIKFSLIGLLTTVIQIVLLCWLYHLMSDVTAPLPAFLAFFFSEATVGPHHSNWGFVLPLLISLTVTNIISYFLNKKATFRSDAPWWHFPLYLFIMALLIMFSAWIQGMVFVLIMDLGYGKLAPAFSSIIAAVVQGLILFPIHKYILLREPGNKD